MAGGLDSLSADEFKQLSKTIEEAKELIKQQEAMLQQMLEMERKISKERVAGLVEYSDAYFRMLNAISSEHDALRTDMFFINQSGNEAAAAAEKAAAAAEKAAGAAKNSGSGGNASKNDDAASAAKGKKVSQKVDDAKRDKLNEADAARVANIAEKLTSFTKQYKTAEERLNAILKREHDAVITIEQLKDHRRARREEAEKQSIEKSLKLEESLLDLTMARLQEHQDIEARQHATQLVHMQEAVNAELAARQLINQTKAEWSFAASDDGQNFIAQKANAEELQKSIKLLEEQRAIFIAQEELKEKLANQRELTEQEKARIAERANEEFELSQENLERITAARKKFGDEYFEKEKKYQNTLLALEQAKQHDSEKAEARLQDLRLSKQLEEAEARLKLYDQLEQAEAELQLARETNIEELAKTQQEDAMLTKRLDATKAELDFQTKINQLKAQRIVDEAPPTAESLELDAKKTKATDDLKSAEELEARRIKFIADEERKFRLKNHRERTAEERAELIKRANLDFELSQENLDKMTELRKKAAERQAKVDEAKANAEERSKLRSELNTLQSAETFEERKQALYNLTHDEDGNADVGKALSAAMLAVSDLAKQLEGKIDEIASYKSDIDTRLYGSNNKKFLGSYWDQLQRDMMSVGAVNPFFKQEDFANNIKSLVDEGIAFDLEQRAFLMTIQNKIATTFEVADGTMLRLIRLQQADSTAGRLGMEASLNAFLNNMYENTEYLKRVADGVRTSLEEMQALMEGAEAAEVEYQVQKWLGSLYSVGMSDTAVNSIATALGQIAAGQIEGLTSNGAGNLLIMAANDASNVSISDILAKGITADQTNELMKSVVNYLAEIAESTKDNNVVQQQLADVFGVKASDLRAAINLTSKNSVSSIYDKNATYSNMLNTLFSMAGSMGSRTSMAELMSNFWNNGQFTLASSMASNPVSYFIYKMAKVVDDAAGGIDLPFVNVMGFGVDLNTTVSDLMRVAAVGAGLLGSIGPLVSGLSNSFDGQKMLKQLGIESGSGLKVTPRGSGSVSATVGGGSSSTSGSGYVGNSSSSDVKNATIQESKDSKKQLMVEAKEEEEANQVNILNETVLKIYELLDDVAHGNGYFRVKVDNYGLTNGKSSSNSLGGVGGLGNLGGGAGGSSSGGSSGGGVSDGGSGGGVSGGSFGSSGTGVNISFGGWTTTM